MTKLGRLLWMAGLSCLLVAQPNLAELEGDVMDMLGRPIANAEVVCTKVDTTSRHRVRTDKNGKFHLLGLAPGVYQVEITGPDGENIFSGKKLAVSGDANAVNVIHIDLSLVPTAASLTPFKGPNARQIQGEAWRKAATETSRNDLSHERAAELREENAAIAHYIELAPEAQSAIKSQDWPRAEQLLKQMAAVAPYMWQVYSNLGMIQRNRGLYAGAVDSYEKGIQALQYDETLKKDQAALHSAMAQMMIGEGEVYSASRQLDAAAAAYRRAADTNPRSALAYIHLCVTEYNTGHAETALEDCRTAIAADSRHPEFYQILGGIEMNLEKYQEAISAYDKGARLALKKLETAKDSLSSSVASSAYPQYSIPALTQGLSQQMLPAAGNSFYRSQAGQMLLAEGNAYFQLRKFKPAADLFARAATLHDYPALAYFNLCVTRFDLGEWNPASEACDRALAVDPEKADAYYVKAAAAFARAAQHGTIKPPKEALSDLQKYLELDPEGSYSSQARAMLQEIPARPR